jgi:heptosyltransferase-2
MLKDLDLKENHYVCLFPGARYGPAKRWDLSRFALLGDTVIAKFGFEVVILGSKEDTGECQAMEGRMAKPSINLCGKLDLSALVGVLSSSRAVVSNDSGGMHLSASLGIPVVALFFSTDPGWTQPISPRSVVLHSRLPCSPCFRRDCDKGHPCTESITVDQVADALDELVGEET